MGCYINLFHLVPLNMNFNNIVSLLLYFFAVLFLVKEISGNVTNYKKSCIMCLVILTSPLLAEQYAFTLQNVEVASSYFLLIVVMIGISRFIYQKKYIYFLLTPFLILVFGTYQSFYLMYITLTIVFYLNNYDDNLKLKEQIGIILTYIIIFLVYIGLTIFIGNFVNEVLGIETTGYLTNQMNWINGNVVKGILYSGYYGVKVLLGLGIDNNLGFSILIFIVFFHLKKEAKDKKVVYKLAMIMLLISPFLISILFGTVTFDRAQFSIPIIMAYLYGKFLNKKNICVIVIGVILVQSFSTFYLFYSDLERYRNDMEVFQYVKEVENTSELPIVFIGKVDYESKIVGEVLGKSFYNWDYKTERLSNDRIAAFMEVEGFNYTIPTLEQINEVKANKDLYKELVNYTDSYIVINLDMYHDYF